MMIIEALFPSSKQLGRKQEVRHVIIPRMLRTIFSLSDVLPKLKLIFSLYRGEQIQQGWNNNIFSIPFIMNIDKTNPIFCSPFNGIIQFLLLLFKGWPVIWANNGCLLWINQNLCSDSFHISEQAIFWHLEQFSPRLVLSMCHSPQ